MSAATPPLPRPRLIEPGLLAREPGVERYRVRGGGALVLALSAGDRITITDPEGRQRCEVAAFRRRGDGATGRRGDGARADLAALGTRVDGVSQGLAALGTYRDEDARAVIAALMQHGIDPESVPAVHLFSGETRPGTSESFTATRDVLCVVTAPGKPMRPDEQDPPTDLTVVLRRPVAQDHRSAAVPPPSPRRSLSPAAAPGGAAPRPARE